MDRITTPNLAALIATTGTEPAPYSSKQSQSHRQGTWTVEEEKYVSQLIEEFKDGHLPLKEGISLRSFLAKMVHCKYVTCTTSCLVVC